MEENNQNVLPTETETANKSCCGICDKKSCWKWIFLVALLFLTVSLVYAGYQFSKLSQKPTVVYQPTPTPLPAEASVKEDDPTANWKTYTSPYNLFSIKYPAEFVLVGNGLYPFGTPTSTDPHNDNPEKKTVIVLGGGGRGEIIPLEAKTYPAGEARIGWSITPNNEADGVAYFIRPKGTFLFQATYIPLVQSENIKKIFDQILSTLKFLD